MSDIKFNCPSCKQSLEAPSDMAGQLVDCPSCKKPIEVPIPRQERKAEFKAPPPRTPPPPRQPPPRSVEPAVASTATVLPKILTVLVLIAVMVGAFFGYNFWKDQQRAKAEAPFFVAARDALDDAHRLQSALGVGLSYQKYGDELITLASKVDNLLRAAVDTGIENLKPDARVFCQKLVEAREAFRHARFWWDLKIKYPESPDADEHEKSLQEDWSKASKAVDEADRLYSKLKNQ